MNAASFRFVFLIVVMLAPSFAAAQAPEPDAAADDLAKPKTTADVKEPSADEQAVRDAIAAYVAAYNRGDAAAIGALFSDSGEWISGDAARLRGSKEIEAAMKKIFAAAPGAKLELANVAFRFVAPDVAMEEGIATVTLPNGSHEVSSYAATHVRRGKAWKLESVRELIVALGVKEPTPPNPLAPLGWLVGRWVDEAEGSRIETNVEWRADGHFLFYQFRAILPNAEPLVGTQIIGYDAASGTIRSWLFDNDGTIGEGTWIHDGKQWIVKSTQTLPSGVRASSTNVYEPRDSESYAWKSFGRKVGDRFLPNIDTVLVVRDRTAPAAAAKPAEKSTVKAPAPTK